MQPKVVKSDPATIRLIEKVRKVQYHLQCESSMSEVEVHLRTLQHRETLLDGVTQFFNLQRRHLLHAYLALLVKTSPLPAWFPEFQANPLVVRKQEIGPEGLYSRMFVRTALSRPPARDAAILDLWTFLLPSRFHSLVVDSSCADFLILIRGLPPALGDRLARSFFLTPAFLTFSAAVFRPVLSVSAGKHIDKLGRAIVDRWTAQIANLPISVKLLLTPPDSKGAARGPTIDPVHILSASFFEIALQPGNARLYGLVELWMDLSTPLRTTLTSLLTEKATQSILPALVAAVQQSQPSPDSYLTSDDVKDLQSLFGPFIASELDASLYSELRTNRLEPVEHYTPSRMWEDQIQTDGEVNAIAQTMAESSPSAWIRHLLQRADPIPAFNSVPPGMTVDGFFRTYVVERGPEPTAYERAVNYHLLCKNAKSGITEASMLGPLQGATFERKKELRTLSRFSRITRVCARLIGATEEGRAIAERALAWGALESWMRLRKRQPVRDYLVQPQSLTRAHGNMIETLAKEGGRPAQYSPGPRDDEVIFCYLSAEITFKAFQEARPELAPWDIVVHKDLENTRLERARKQFLVKGEVEPKDAWVQKTVLGLKESQEGAAVVARMEEAFGQSHPLRMLREFAAAMVLLRELLVKVAPADTVVGADQYQPSTIALALITAPLGLVSTYVFLHDYCRPAEFLGTEEKLVLPPFDYIIAQTIADTTFNLASLCKWHPTS